MDMFPDKEKKEQLPDFTSIFENMGNGGREIIFLQLSSFMIKNDVNAVIPMVDSLLDLFVKFSGNITTIDRDFILRFPILDFHSLYDRMGINSKSLTLSNITQEEAMELLPLFTNIESLVLQGMEIQKENLIEYPTGVKFLKLSRCHSSSLVLPDSFNQMLRSLESIHIDRFNCSNYENENRSWSFKDELKIRNIIVEAMEADLVRNLPNHCKSTLEMLTFKNTTGKLYESMSDNCLVKLKRLTIENCSAIIDFWPVTVVAPALEYFTFHGEEMEEIPLVITDDHPLKSLEIVTIKTILRIDNILKLTKLEHVKIHCEWYNAEELRNHLASLSGIESYDVTSIVAATIGYDLVHSLDANSLRKIFSYLPYEDMDSISLVHPKFCPLVPDLRINKKFLETYPLTDVSFYQEFGAQVQRVKITVSATEFNVIMPYLTNLQSLRICIKEADAIDLRVIPLIEEFSVSIMDLSDVCPRQWIALFRRLNAKLKNFDYLGSCSGPLIAGLNELTNLEVFTLIGNWFEIKDFQFLKRNKKLSVLSLDTLEEDICHFKIARFISRFGNAKNIRSLTLQTYYEFTKDLAVVFNRFENLEHLSLLCPMLFPLSVDKLALNKLSSVAVDGFRTGVEYSDVLLKLIRHFPNLKKITLSFESTLKRSWVTKFHEILESEGDINYTFRFRDYNDVIFTR